MYGKIEHDWNQETIEAKTRWFQSLSITDRMELFCSFTDLALAINPNIQGQKHVESVTGRIYIISKADLIASKKAAGRKVDLEDVRLLELDPDTKADTEIQ